MPPFPRSVASAAGSVPLVSPSDRGGAGAGFRACPWLTIIGLGGEGMAGLSGAARGLLAAARVVIGPPALLAQVPITPDQDRLAIDDRPEGGEDGDLAHTLFPHLDRFHHQGVPTCLLTAGNPMVFGPGPALAARYGVQAVSVLPHVSLFSIAAARLGWALEDCVLATARSAPLETVLRDLAPRVRFLILARDSRTPQALVRMLARAGFTESRVTVFQDLSGPQEERLSFVAGDGPDRMLPQPDIIAVEAEADQRAAPLGRGPGLPDSVFEHGDRLLVQDLRAATLAALVPLPGALLWHVGAGCGDVAVEWMRAAPRARAVAFERDRLNFTRIARNAVTLGVPDLDVAPGDALEAMAARSERPDAVFLGGALRSEGVLETCWERLRPGGILVAHATTLEAEARLLAWFGTHGGDLTRSSIQRLVIGPQGRRLWSPTVPVTQYRGRKP